MLEQARDLEPAISWRKMQVGTLWCLLSSNLAYMIYEVEGRGQESEDHTAFLIFNEQDLMSRLLGSFVFFSLLVALRFSRTLSAV